MPSIHAEKALQPPGITLSKRSAGRCRIVARSGGRAIRDPAAPKTGEVYRSIGVRPVINARGTFTIITGSQTLPEVKRAMDEASRSYVQMDELMEGVSQRLAELTGAPSGASSPPAAAPPSRTAPPPRIAGRNPERMQRLPDLTGLKNEVIIPAYSHNVYDHAIRMVGVKIVEVQQPGRTRSGLQRAHRHGLHSRRTGRRWTARHAESLPKSPSAHNVPVIVDAAAEILTIPNVHLRARRHRRRLQRRQVHSRSAGRRSAAGRQESAAGAPGSTARRITPSAAR